MAHLLFIIHRPVLCDTSKKEDNCAENRTTRTSSSPWSIQAQQSVQMGKTRALLEVRECFVLMH